MPNLPIIGNSEDAWGQENNDFLTVSHEPSGSAGGKLKTTALDGINFTGTISLSASSEVILPSSTSIGSISSIEISYLDGVTSNIQTQLDSKSITTHTHVLTGGATDITATAVEINQVTEGVGASVTAITLTDLTSGGYDASPYHYHSTDRARANHTGIQSPSTISPQGSGSGLDADKLRGKSWVLTASGSGTINADSSGSFTLETAGQHNQYMFSVYTTSGAIDQTGATNNPSGDAFVPSIYAFIRRPSAGTDSLIIHNHTASNEDINYEVYTWKSV